MASLSSDYTDTHSNTGYSYNNYLTMYDNSGKIKVNYFYNNSNANNSYYQLYQILDNGTTIEYSLYYNKTYPMPHRLQSSTTNDVDASTANTTTTFVSR